MSRPSTAAGTVADRERAELFELLRRDGILYRSETQPIVSRDGSSGRWMLDSLCVSLTPRGGELAARCLLRLLEQFEGRQLATYGLIGVPLLEGCILHGGGRYRGALVRKERKAHGSLKLIEGQLDLSEPVIVVDDSVSSGYSMAACVRTLEEAGFQVEGGVCLVRFDYGRGTAKMVERGYKMSALFDVHEDFLRHMDGEVAYPLNPTKKPGPLPLSTRQARPGLHPATLARDAIAEYLRSGTVLAAPPTLDRAYDGAGGCWVSLRRRSNVHDRPARSGFWHFPREERGTVAGDVVLAAVQAARQLARDQPDPLRALDECAIAVTFFSALEECTVGELDNDRYGIVVRSIERPPSMGGALPRMPGIANEWQQFVHAWRNNARLFPHEPYRLYRHDVEKVVEPGATWQPTGTPAPRQEPWHQDRSVLGPLATRARALVLEALGAKASGGGAATGRKRLGPLPAEAVAAFVTVYANGRLVGCAGGRLGELEASLRACAVAATSDPRFDRPRAGDAVAVSVSVLFNRHEIGNAAPEWVVRPARFAEQALEVRQGDRHGMLLPFVAVTGNLSPLQYVREVVDKAGITRPPYHWTRYDCATWLADGATVSKMEHGLPQGAPAPTARAQLERLRRLLVAYTRRHHVAKGTPAGRYEVFADRLRTGGLTPDRLAYGAWVKARASLRAEARDDVRRLERGLRKDGWIRLGGHRPSISELAFLLLARAELAAAKAPQRELAAKLWGQIDLHGRFTTHRDPEPTDTAYQDYAPGQALLALATAAERGATEVDDDAVRRALRHYRMRFRQNHHWGAVAWLTQAFVAWGRVLDDDALTGFAYEVADWALQFQSQKSGGFLNDHQACSPGATTALYLEGLGAVWAAAAADASTARADRYRSACQRGLAFLDRLVYQRRDAAVLPNPAWAVGGIRTALTASEVRIDYVGHALAAVLTLRPLVRESGP